MEALSLFYLLALNLRSHFRTFNSRCENMYELKNIPLAIALDVTFHSHYLHSYPNSAAQRTRSASIDYEPKKHKLDSMVDPTNHLIDNRSFICNGTMYSSILRAHQNYSFEIHHKIN